MNSSPGSPTTCAPRWPACARCPRPWRTASPPTPTATCARSAPRWNASTAWSATSSNSPASTPGALALSPSRMSLYDLVGDALAGADPLAREHGVRLVGDRVEPVPVEVDGKEMSRVLGNLLVNAIRRTPADGTVAVAAERSPDGVVLSVTDGCGGIPEEDLPRVFDTGWRGTHARTPPAGAGLGLAIVRGHRGGPPGPGRRTERPRRLPLRGGAARCRSVNAGASPVRRVSAGAALLVSGVGVHLACTGAGRVRRRAGHRAGPPGHGHRTERPRRLPFEGGAARCRFVNAGSTTSPWGPTGSASPRARTPASPPRSRPPAFHPSSARSRAESAVMCRTSPRRYSPVTTGSGPPYACGQRPRHLADRVRFAAAGVVRRQRALAANSPPAPPRWPPPRPVRGRSPAAGRRPRRPAGPRRGPARSGRRRRPRRTGCRGACPARTRCGSAATPPTRPWPAPTPPPGAPGRAWSSRTRCAGRPGRPRRPARGQRRAAHAGTAARSAPRPGRPRPADPAARPRAGRSV